MPATVARPALAALVLAILAAGSVSPAPPAPGTSFAAAPWLSWSAETAPGSADPAQALRLVHDATAWQATVSGQPVRAAPAPIHGLPSAAALALYQDVAGDPPPEVAVEALSLDRLPPRAAAALARLIDAFAGFRQASLHAFAPAQVAQATTVAEAGLPAEALARLGVDLGPLFGARVALVEAAVALGAALGPAPAAQACAPTDLVVLSVDTAQCDNVYDGDYVLLVDTSGNDLYLNNGGGASAGAAALVDLRGDDRYASGRSRGANGGGAFFGSGFLFDGAGGDTYAAGGEGVNGGARQVATGFLLDAGAGNDNFTALDHGVNGGGSQAAGLGLLIDQAGDSAFRAGLFGVNGGGSSGGSGTLLDLGGNDLVHDTFCTRGVPAFASSFGSNGGSSTGVGTLVNSGGNDHYCGLALGTNGGAAGTGGSALLLDLGGNDRYTELGRECMNCDQPLKGTVGNQLDS